MTATTTERRRYQKVHPSNHRVMHRLHDEYLLTLPQIADLFGCSRSRVVQVISQFKEN